MYVTPLTNLLRSFEFSIGLIFPADSQIDKSNFPFIVKAATD